MSDGDEAKLGTNPENPDTDSDGLRDGKEVALGTDPNKADTDGDGVSDADEGKLGANPLNPDTDGDGLRDGEEVALGTDPNKTDTDEDRLSDADEKKLGTNPLNPDTDGDGLRDGEEVALGTDPKKADTDGDGLPDSVEVQFFLDPLTPTTTMTVAEVYCDDLVAIAPGPDLVDQVYEQFLGDSFADWRAGDPVIEDEDGDLINLLRPRSLSGIAAHMFVGNVTDTTSIANKSPIGEWIRLADEASEWRVNFLYDEDVADWGVGDPIVVTVELDVYKNPKFWRFVNAKTCEWVLVNPP